ncbi:MAG: DUF971 domain-containing protein [Proteobacteria bacterium]|nr:DUF971 domain-containing protein [Pseudomonadota bacterium]
MTLLPVEIRRMDGAGIRVRWSDGSIQELSSSILRTNCPCATCREAQGDTSHGRPLTGSAPAPKKKSMLKVIEHTMTEQLTLTEIWGVGNYALGMAWADGHNSGIYSFEYLRRLDQL